MAIEVLRDRSRRTFDTTLGELKSDSTQTDKSTAGKSSGPFLGIEVADSPQGVVVSDVDSNGPSGGSLQRGDVILEINRSSLRRASDLAPLVRKTPQGLPVLLKVNRDGKTLFVAIDRS